MESVLVPGLLDALQIAAYTVPSILLEKILIHDE